MAGTRRLPPAAPFLNHRGLIIAERGRRTVRRTSSVSWATGHEPWSMALAGSTVWVSDSYHGTLTLLRQSLDV
jgi:hypothetical protein